MKNIIELVHLKKTFGNHEVLRDINLTVKKGDVISIIGSSGSGKSTMLRCVNLLETPTDGKILFEGKDISDKAMKLSQYRAKVVMVFQQFNLFNNMTALANCVRPQMIVLKRTRAEAEAEAKKYLEMVGMSAYLNARPAQLSGGQKQRIAIARALLNAPEVIVADEPTGNLDEETAESILRLLRSINEEHGTAIVMVTHNRSITERYPGRIFEIKDEKCEEKTV